MNKNQQDELVDAMQETADLFAKHNHAINMEGIGDYKFGLWYRFKEWVEDNNPFGGYMYVSSYVDYMSRPWKDRSVYRIWYRDAIITGGSSILGSKKERDSIENFLEYKYPVQFFLRAYGFKLKVKLSVGYDWLRHTLNPRQKWLTKKIPKGWTDKTWLIPEVNFAMVVDFVDGEKCFEHTDYENSGELQSGFSKELKECYEYIKTTRPKLQQDHDNSYPDEDTRTGDYNIDYAETNHLELLLNKEDTKWLVWIVTNRDFFWT